MRVLILEDDPELADQIAAMLRDENHAVDVADDGEEGLTYGLENDYDAVILDPGLPTIDGFSVLRRWREAGRTMPVIVLTGSRKEVTDMKEAVRAGATNYLTKPVDIDTLERTFGVGENGETGSQSVDSIPEAQFLSLARHEREYIEFVLAECGGNISEAARRLGLHRQSLQRKLRKYPPR